MTGEFYGRAALVTGGAAGIGREIVLALVAEGAAVGISDVNARAAEELAESITLQGGRAIATIGDVSVAEDARRMVGEAIGSFGRLDILVNNAGICPPDWYYRIEDTPESVWDRIIAVNLKGVFLMSKYALPEIRRTGRNGVVVNISSAQALQSEPKVPSYAASKGGILAMTRNMALDYAPDGIRVVAICPGTIDSELLRTAAHAAGGDEKKTLDRWGALHPIGRLGLPGDVARAVVFLASENASFITGEYLNVDGGYMAQGAWASANSKPTPPDLGGQ